MTRSLLKRLAIFIFGAPVVLGVIYFLPYYQNFAFVLVAFSFTIASIIELHRMLVVRLLVYPLGINMLIGLAMPVFSFIYSHGFVQISFVVQMVTFFILAIFIFEFIFSFNAEFSDSIARIAGALFITIYPGLFISFAVLLTALPYANELLTILLGMVFICDSAAWLFGVTMGKSTRGCIPASPKKSLVGFLGGILGANLVGIIAYYIFPQTFGSSLQKVVVLATITGFVAIFGDLFESILKRSANVKDSGRIVMGRGGALDSIDSILLAAPVFYFLYQMLFIMPEQFLQ